MENSKPEGQERPDPGTTTLHRLRELDNLAWVDLVTQYFDRVYRWCIEAGLDEHTSSDVAQEVFVSALGSLHRFKRDDSSSFGGWLRRITQRRVADYLRRRPEVAAGGTDSLKMFSQIASIRHSLDESTEGLEDQNKTLSDIQDDRLLAVVAKAQTEFETTTWQAFWMSTVDGRSTTDIALELGITKNAVYLAKSRITKRLRAILEAESSK